MSNSPIPKTVIGASEYFLNSLGYEVPEELKRSHTSCSPHRIWHLVQQADKETGFCYLSWCENWHKRYLDRRSLHEFLSSTEPTEIQFRVDDWVCYLPWFRTSRKYGVVIELRSHVNHKPGPFPLVRWLDGTESFTSGDFSRVVPKPARLLGTQGVQRSLLQSGEILV